MSESAADLFELWQQQRAQLAPVATPPLPPHKHVGNSREIRDDVFAAWCSCGWDGPERVSSGTRTDRQEADAYALDDLDRHHTQAIDEWLAYARGQEGRQQS